MALSKGKRKKITAAIRKFWDSLETHLDSTHDKFHRDTCKEYIGAMRDLIDTL